MFLFLNLVSSVEDCQLYDNNVVTTNFLGACNSTRGLLEKISSSFIVADKIPINSIMSFGTPETKNGQQLDVMNYVYGLIGLAIPIALFALLSFIFLSSICCCGTCCGCCCKCCLRKKGSLSLIWFIAHLCFCLVLLIGCVFKFMFGSLFTKGIDSAIATTPKVQGTLDKVYTIFNQTIDGAVGSVDDTLNSTEALFNTLIGEVDSKTDTAVTAAGTVISSIDDVENNLGAVETDATTFDTHFAPINEKCQLQSSLKLADSIASMRTQLQKISTQVDSFKQAEAKIKSFKTEINGQLSKVTSDVTEQVDGFKNQTTTFLDPLVSAETQIGDVSKLIKKYLDPVKNYFTIFMWLFIVIIFILTIMIIVIYFFKNCCAKLCFCCYFPLASIYAFILFMLGTVFAALFFALNDVCNVSEEAIEGIASSALGNGTDIHALLVCPEPKSIYQLANMKEMFDYEQIIQDLKQQIQNMIQNVEPGEGLLESLNMTSSLNIINQFNISTLRGFNTGEIRDLLKKLQQNAPEGSQCKSALNDNIDAINTALSGIDSKFEGFTQPLETAKNSANITLNTANEFIPLITESTNKTKTLVYELTDEILEIVNNGIDQVDCTLICPVYTTVINTACVYLVDSLGFEVVGIIITFCALLALSVTILNRKVNMSAPKVEALSEEEDDDEDEDEEDINLDNDYKTNL